MSLLLTQKHSINPEQALHLVAARMWILYSISENMSWLSPSGILMRCWHVVQRLGESLTAQCLCSKAQIQGRCTCRVSLWMCQVKCVAWGVFSQLYCVVGRKQPAFPPQPPFPPRRIRAIQHFDDVPGAEAEFVVFLCGEVVQRLHLHRRRPLWDSRRKTSDSQHLTDGSINRKLKKLFSKLEYVALN